MNYDFKREVRAVLTDDRIAYMPPPLFFFFNSKKHWSETEMCNVRLSSIAMTQVPDSPSL